jgi:hypothetical protein
LKWGPGTSLYLKGRIPHNRKMLQSASIRVQILYKVYHRVLAIATSQSTINMHTDMDVTKINPYVAGMGLAGNTRAKSGPSSDGPHRELK